MHENIYTYMHTCMHTYIHTYTHLYTNTYKNKGMTLCTCMHTLLIDIALITNIGYVDTDITRIHYTHTHIHTNITYIHCITDITRIHRNMHSKNNTKYTCIDAYIHTWHAYIHTYIINYITLHEYTHANRQTHIHTSRANINVHIRTCINAYMHT